ncbi:caldesmon-like [Zophobas morio]|uniref:caldesmon-like n=1 Tax=Zophobas morio TaxID=2755281 RepID=UPI00308373B8
MTRFARAKGSKASNERVPEDATPWSEMKKQLLEKKQHAEEAKKKQEADKQRQKNYKRFLDEVGEEESKNSKWAEFPKKGTKQKADNDVIETEVKPPKRKKLEENNNVGETEQRHRKKKVKVVAQKGGAQQENASEGASTNQKKQKIEDPSSTNGMTNKQQPKKKKKLKILTGEDGQQLQIPTSDKKSENEVTAKAAKVVKQDKKTPKVVAKKKGIRNKNKQNNGNQKGKPEKPATNTPPSEEDLKKIEKKKQKKIRQLEKRKLNTENQPKFSQPSKKHTKFQNKQKPERRKEFQNSMIINGEEVEIAYVDNFPIKKEDADRIKQLRKQMISKGLPRSEINVALKLERRKAEKALARLKKKVCFNCRKSGHNLSECPSLNNQMMAESSGTGICFKCGSTEHTHFECKVVRGQEFKFAQCFICNEQGHIARQCPDNARGLYPKGGACKVCGDVTHLKKDCPKYQMQQHHLEQSVKLGVMNSDNPDNLDRDDEPVNIKETKRPNKIVKF